MSLTQRESAPPILKIEWATSNRCIIDIPDKQERQMSETQNVEYVTAVLQITRDQLSRSISLNAELEAALNLERQRNELLQAELQKLQGAKDKGKDTNSPPTWNFLCVREIENAKRERIERMGFIPAFEADMEALANNYGRMAAEGKAFLATLSDDSDDAETSR